MRLAVLRHPTRTVRINSFRRLHSTAPLLHAYSRVPPSSHPALDQDSRDRIQRISAGIASFAKDHELLHVLRLFRGLREECRAANVNPSLDVFKHLLSLWATFRSYDQAVETIKDVLHLGIRPDLEAFNYVLAAGTETQDDLGMVFDLMRLSHVSPDAQSYHHLIARHAHFQNLEAALLQLEKLDSSELTPLVDSLNTLALTALDLGEVKIAHDLALRAESRYDTLLPTSTWLQLIEAAAGASFLPPILYGINSLASSDFTEGLLLDILAVAGRYAQPELAQQCIDILEAKDIVLQEYHFAPLIQAQCAAGHFKQAVESVNDLRTRSLSPRDDEAGPSLHTVLPFRDAFLTLVPASAGPDEPLEVTEVGQSGEAADAGGDPAEALSASLEKAFDLLRDLHHQGTAIDISVFNAALLASVESDHFHRALVEFKSMSDSLHLQPTIDTFNILLKGCIEARHLFLGKQLMVEMQNQDVTPDQTSYERIIQLCLACTDDDGSLGEAFGYLETLKKYGVLPSIDVYRAFLLRLGNEGDARRSAVRAEVEGYYGKGVASRASRLARGTMGTRPNRKNTRI